MNLSPLTENNSLNGRKKPWAVLCTVKCIHGYGDPGGSK